jgi:putative addiction module component (TIGR02574 family)
MIECWRCRMETSKALLEKALLLKPQERFMLIEGLLTSLDEPDRVIDKAWQEEAEKRLSACRKSTLRCIPAEEVFGEKL